MFNFMASDGRRDGLQAAKPEKHIVLQKGGARFASIDARFELVVSTAVRRSAEATRVDSRKETYLGHILKMTLGVGGVEGVHGCSDFPLN